MTVLLDGNVLVALVVPEHLHHDIAEAWFAELAEPFATCPITQGTLLRLLVRGGAAPADAWQVLSGLSDHERHEFWPDEISYRDVPDRGLVGHRQVTDAYLAALARRRRGRLATLDKGLAALHADVAVAVPQGRGGQRTDTSGQH